jgi:hypothetical protein
MFARYFAVVNLQVADPEPDPLVPLVCAVYVVPLLKRADGVNVTVVHGELHAVLPFT